MWTITVEGGPAFWTNAKAALEIAGERSGPVTTGVLQRLREAEATYTPTEPHTEAAPE